MSNITFSKNHSLEQRQKSSETVNKTVKSETNAKTKTANKTAKKAPKQSINDVTKSLTKNLNDLKEHYDDIHNKELGDFIIFTECSLNKYLDSLNN